MEQNDETIVAAIISSGTIGKAAKKLGISTRTISNRMKAPDFKVVYQNARADVVRNTVHDVNAHLTEAVRNVAEIMNDQNVNPQTRLQACRIIIEASVHLADRLTKYETAVDAAVDDWFNIDL